MGTYYVPESIVEGLKRRPPPADRFVPATSFLVRAVLAVGILAGTVTGVGVIVTGASLLTVTMSLGHAAPLLERFGALAEAPFADAIVIALFVTAAALVAQIVVRLVLTVWRRDDGVAMRVLLGVALSPWLWLGLFLVAVDLILIRVEAPAGIAGAAVLASVIWPLGAVLLVTVIASFALARAAFRAGSRSPSVASVLTILGLAAPAGVYVALLLLNTDAMIAAVPRTDPACSGVVDCCYTLIRDALR